jgi:hypothetical protein
MGRRGKVNYGYSARIANATGAGKEGVGAQPWRLCAQAWVSRVKIGVQLEMPRDPVGAVYWIPWHHAE